MTSAQVVEMSVTNNSSFQNYPLPDDHTIQTTDTRGFKPFTILSFFFTKVQEAALNLWSVIKTHLKAHWLSCKKGKIFHQKSLMTQYTLIFPSEAT